MSALVLAGVMLAGLTLYLLGGGADFGGGVWDLLAVGKRAKAQRELIEGAIGPIWEANHVWFIFVFTVYFAAFPPAFAYTVSALFAPLTAYAVGIVLRGAAFTFRHYDPQAGHARSWSLLFSIASLLCPFLLGLCGAALARDVPLTAPLVEPFTVASGLFLVSLVAALAAAYLCVSADGEQTLEDDFRLRGMMALGVAGAFAAITIALAASRAATLQAQMFREPIVWVLATTVGVSAMALLYLRQYRLARAATVVVVVLVVVGWAWVKGTMLAPAGATTFTVANSQAHPATLTTLLIACGSGSLLLFPSLFLLFRVFGARTSTPERRKLAQPEDEGARKMQ